MNMAEPLNWQREGRDWPHREASQFVQAAGLRWHVQSMPRIPDVSRSTVLLIHGTGSATHSWRGLMPRLAATVNVVAVDLPGHGFTQSPVAHRFSLPEMATGLTALLKVMRLTPQVVAGHSAGAAILARMCIDGGVTPRHFISVNGALLPLSGLAGELFSPVAKLLSRSKLVPRLFAWRASDPSVLHRLIEGTGSSLDEEGHRLYGTLIGNAGHAAAALEMMAQWDLQTFAKDLPQLGERVPMMTLVVGGQDKTVPPSEAVRVQRILPSARVVHLAGLGHLAHEEAPEQFVDIILKP
jgi:magnesium chelatase accessory protein